MNNDIVNDIGRRKKEAGREIEVARRGAGTPIRVIVFEVDAFEGFAEE